jgi:hypothetical protein
VINPKQIEALDLICEKYNVKKSEAMTKLVNIEEYIHIKEMVHGTSINFNRSYFYLALGHLSNYYKKD